MQKGVRLYYLAGAADIASDYKTWKEKQSNAVSFGGGVFMEQFFQFCHEIDAHAKLVSTADGTNLRAGRFTLEYRNPNPKGFAGLRYHLRLIGYMFGIMASITRFKPDLVLLGIAERYWFMLYIFYFSRIKFVPFLHCTLWPRMKSFDQLTLAQKFLFHLTGNFLEHRCEAVLAISDAIDSQISKITRHNGLKIFKFRPIYEPTLFNEISSPDWNQSPFRIIYVGRVEVNKGIYDLLKVAKLLKKRGGGEVFFDVCGTGDALLDLRNAVRQDSLVNIHIHGHCDRKRLSRLYSQCHAVIVPTTKDFPEGFNRVSIEAILCGRPVIISSAAIESKIAAAALEVSPSDAGGFANAIVELRDNRNTYERLCRGAVAAQEYFYDNDAGWENALRNIMIKAGGLTDVMRP